MYLVSVVVLFCPLLSSSENVIKANMDPVIGQAFQSDQNMEPAFRSKLKMETAPEFYSKDICGEPECGLVCSEGQVGDNCNEDHDR